MSSSLTELLNEEAAMSTEEQQRSLLIYWSLADSAVVLDGYMNEHRDDGNEVRSVRRRK